LPTQRTCRAIGVHLAFSVEHAPAGRGRGIALTDGASAAVAILLAACLARTGQWPG
jgi:hypothetical protein